jgi:hypothetical protein
MYLYVRKYIYLYIVSSISILFCNVEFQRYSNQPISEIVQKQQLVLFTSYIHTYIVYGIVIPTVYISGIIRSIKAVATTSRTSVTVDWL